MVLNPEYDLSRSLQSALKAKATIVGISMPGHSPLIFQRKKLAAALKGVKPTSIHVEVFDGTKDRYLSVHGTAGASIRTRMRMRFMPRHEALYQMKSGIEILDRITRPRVTKYSVQLKRLERELKELGREPERGSPWDSRRHVIADYVREDFLKWHSNKRMRTVVGAIAQRYMGTAKVVDSRYARMDMLSLYAELRSAGVSFKTVSELSTYEKRRFGMEPYKGSKSYKIEPYLKNLYKICGLASGWSGATRSVLSGGEDHAEWGPERYHRVIAFRRERRRILESIADVKQMASY